jgi:hypothetical protein
LYGYMCHLSNISDNFHHCWRQQSVWRQQTDQLNLPHTPPSSAKR